MSTHSSSTDKGRKPRRISYVLAFLSVIALALAASPTALADERGRPGALSVQQANLEYVPVFRSHLRFVSWSD